MKLPQAVIIHGLAHARIALAPGLPVTLLSAPGAGVYAGVGWWRAVIQAAAREHTQATAVPAQLIDVLDCGDAAGRALEALRGGQRRLVLRAEPALLADLQARAASCGGEVLATPPPSLDLAAPGAARNLGAWLNQSG